MGAVALGSAVGAVTVGLVGANAAFVLVGLVLPVLALVSYRRLRTSRPRCRRRRALDVVEEVPIFAPLSLAAKEQVAAKLSDATSEAGQTVMRAGDAGDLFYIVRDGELTVTVGSEPPRAACGRLLRRDRPAPRRAAHGDRDGGDEGPAVCVATRRLPRGGDGPRPRARGGGGRRGRAAAARGGSTARLVAARRRRVGTCGNA